MRFFKLFSFIFLFYFILVNSINACTLVFDNIHPSKIVARNMDWVNHIDTDFRIYPEGIVREGLTTSNPLRWTSKYGSIVTVVYNDIPTDGMNEKGFAAQILSLKESDYGKRDVTIPAMSVIQWLHFYLDNFATVNEAVKFTELNRFQLIPFLDEKTKLWINIHLAMEDATGDFAVIEYINGKAMIYHARNTPVLTNSPAYHLQLENLKKYAGWGGNKSLPGTTDSDQRFVRAAYYISHLPEPKTPHDELVAINSILQNTTQPYGIISDERPFLSFTQWRTFADLTHRIYYFNSVENLNTFWIRFENFNLQPGNPVLKLNLKQHPDLTGDVTKFFEPVPLTSNYKFDR